MEVHRGEVFYADLSPVVGSEQGGIRPVLIIQNEIGNRHSPTVIAAAITSRQDKNRLPTHISVRADRCGLAKDSIILTEQIRTLDKRRLRERAGRIPEDDMRRVDEALGVSMGLESSGAIMSYQAQVAAPMLGYMVKAFVNLDMDPQRKPEFYPYIESCPHVVECNCVTGDYSMLIEVLFATTQELDQFINHLQQFGRTRTQIVFSTPVEHRGVPVSVEEDAADPQK